MLENFYSPKGRMGRIDWWICSTFVTVIAFGFLAFVSGYAKRYGPMTLDVSIIIVAAALMISWASFCISSRRLHDIGRSAWWYLLIFIPLIGSAILLLLWAFYPGTPGTNRFGPRRSGGEAYAGSATGSGLTADEIDDLIRRHANGRGGQGGSRTAMAASGLPPQGQPVVVEKRRVPPGGGHPRPTFGRRGLA
ncbi:DUF805 domain-containing protein [Stappia sp. 28M-7]|uniref:DUF805 domain-containing protein n=1 Tax=Stappia sp. 28M-7 TaxID=2762596 RepID=UPI00163C7076|nr:DUF805 domain-containing protein [Stappia sp. 28M-7]MBC2859161.1 DUF805 domain-containing protein [Stappia sp. 28M-7]